jgi:hypothetical protein
MALYMTEWYSYFNKQFKMEFSRSIHWQYDPGTRVDYECYMLNAIIIYVIVEMFSMVMVLFQA